MADPPPNLEHLQLLEWVRQHPVRSYFPEHPPSDAEIFGKTGISIGVHVVSHLAKALHPVGWLFLAYEILESMGHSADREKLPAKRLEAQREEFRQYMWDKFWMNEAMYDSAGTREAAFDEYVGGNTNHGIVPELTKEAQAKRQELMDQVSDRWLERTEKVNELQQRLQALEASKPDLATSAEHKRNVEQAAGMRKEAAELRRLADIPGSTRWVRDPKVPSGGYDVQVDPGWARNEAQYMETLAKNLEGEVYHRWAAPTEHTRSELASHKAYMVSEAAKDVQSVKDFESRPGNWVYSPEMQDKLTSRGEPQETDERSDNDRFYDVVGGRPN